MTKDRHAAILIRKIFPLVYLLAVTGILYALLSGWAYDDPFITYRYAHNLAQGMGFVYNPGERIQSTTTPLFAVLLAVLYFVSTDLPRTANLISAVCLALGGLLLWDLSRTWKTPIVGWAALLLYPTFTLPAVTTGSETPLYIALCLGAFAFYARQRYAITAAFAALAVLTRPDGLLVAVILGLDYLLRARKPVPWKAVLVFVCVAAPWFLFAWIYFGSPLPITLAAKQQQGTMAVSQTFAPGFFWIIGWYLNGWQYWLEAVLAVIGIYWLARFARQWILLLGWTALYFAAYSLLGVSRYFWYYAPLIPGFIVLVGLGINAMVHGIQSICTGRDLGKRTEAAQVQGPVQPKRLTTCLRISYLLAGLLLVSITAGQAIDIWNLRSSTDSRAEAYRAVGEWIKENTPPETVVSSLEIGIIGYYADRRMVDFAGLLRPEVARQLNSSESYDTAAAWTVENFSPDYVVLVKGDLRTLRQGYLKEHCLVAKHFQSEFFGYADNINLYTCQ